MATTAAILKVSELGPRQLSALRRKAERLGITPERYVKRLIEDDLALDRKAQRSSLDELALPYAKALKDVSDKELDALVDAARTRHHVRSSNHKR
jgi:hypothetical protein